MEGIIYKYTNKINNKVYIGQTTNEKQRYYNHKRCLENSYFHKAIKKYGFENFNYEVIERIDETLLNEREIYWISYYKSYGDRGYNMTIGGNGSRGYKKTEEQIRNNSLSLKGRISPMKGQKFSDESKKKLSESHKGKTHSDETRLKMSESQKKVLERKKSFYKTHSHWKLVEGKRVWY